MMVLTSFALLMPAFSLPYTPTGFANLPSLSTERSPTNPLGFPGFGGVLEPRYIIRATAFDQ